MNKFKIITGSIIIISIIMIIIGIVMMINDREKVESENITENITENFYIEQVEDFVVENDIVYDTDNMMLISDYDTFYTLEKIVKEIIQKIYSKEYNDIHKVISKKFISKNSKEQIKVKLENFNKLIATGNDSISEYTNILYQVYERNLNEYDCLLNIQNNIHYLLIYLNQEDMTYEIRDLILSEEIK